MLSVTIERDDEAHGCPGATFVAKIVSMPDASPDQAMTVVGRICVFQYSIYTTEIFHVHVEPQYSGQSVVKQLYQHVLNLIKTPIVVTGAWLEHERLQRTLIDVGFNKIVEMFSPISNKQVVCYAKANDPGARESTSSGNDQIISIPVGLDSEDDGMLPS